MKSYKQELSSKISTSHRPTLTKKKMRSWQEDDAQHAPGLNILRILTCYPQKPITIS